MLRIQPFGVLGVQMTKDKQEVIRGEDPTELDSCCIVDPAGLHHIKPPGGPYGAGGAARAVYHWLGISQSFQFTKDIVHGVKDTGDAKYRHYRRYRYGVLDKHVIHAVGPDLRNIERNFDAVATPLIKAYHHIFLEFVDSGRQLLRLLPVSSGIFSGDHKEDMPKMTIFCMKKGFHQLTPEKQQELRGKELHLCIFLEKELEAYENAADKEKIQTSRPDESIGVYHAFEEMKHEILVDLGTEVSDEDPSISGVDGIRSRWNSTESIRLRGLKTSMKTLKSFNRSTDRYESRIVKPPNKLNRNSKSEPRRSPSTSAIGRVHSAKSPNKKLYEVAARPGSRS